MEPSVVRSDTVERSDIPLGYTYDKDGRVLTHRNSGGYWYEYTRDEAGRALTFRNSSGYWQAIAHDPEYTLWVTQVGLYLAGCRGPWTADKALEHWGSRGDARAVLFIAAIKQQEGMRSS